MELSGCNVFMNRIAHHHFHRTMEYYYLHSLDCHPYIHFHHHHNHHRRRRRPIIIYRSYLSHRAIIDYMIHCTVDLHLDIVIIYISFVHVTV